MIWKCNCFRFKMHQIYRQIRNGKMELINNTLADEFMRVEPILNCQFFRPWWICKVYHLLIILKWYLRDEKKPKSDYSEVVSAKYVLSVGFAIFALSMRWDQSSHLLSCLNYGGEEKRTMKKDMERGERERERNREE